MIMYRQVQSEARKWQAQEYYKKTRQEYTNAVQKIAAQQRGRMARKEKAKRLQAVIVIQSYWRRYVAMKTFEEVCLARMHINSLVATPFLKPGERVVLAGVVLKQKAHYIGLSKWGRRVLVLTTLPRLLYIDPKTRELRGEIPYTSEVQAVLVDEQEFNCITPKRPFKFRTLMKPGAALWCHVLQNPAATPTFMTVISSRESTRRLSIKDLARQSVSRQSVRQSVKMDASAKAVRSRTMLRNLNWKEGREIGVGKLMQMQGYMMKFEEGFFGRWTRRYFLIQENKLTWFARSVDTEPLGSIPLNEAVIMRDTENSKKNSFTIEATNATGQKVIVRLQAFSPELKKGWVDIIKAITKTDIYPYYY